LCLVAPAPADPLSVVETKLRPEPISEDAEQGHFGTVAATDGDWAAVGVTTCATPAGKRSRAAPLPASFRSSLSYQSL
jgi:hypothetical protein